MALVGLAFLIVIFVLINNPTIALAMDPAENSNLDLSLRLGQPGVEDQKVDWEALEDLSFQRIQDMEYSIGDLIRQFRQEQHRRVPAPEKMEQIVSILRNRNGGVKNLPQIRNEIKANRFQSRYYIENHWIYDELLSKGQNEKP